MKELRQLNQELREKLNAFLQSEEAKKFIETTKAADDTGTFEGLVISTEHEDRQGEIVMQAGMDTSLYMQNPVVLNSHNYYGIENIIGLTTRLYPGEVGGVKATLADGKWAPTEAGQMARKLWDAKMANASSIGFIAQEFDKMRPNVITRSQLLEFSIVPVPANGYATRLRALGLSAEALMTKGFQFKTEGLEPEEAPAPESKTGEQAPEEKKDAQQIGAILAELNSVVSDAIVKASQQILAVVATYGQTDANKAEMAEALKQFSTIQKEITDKIADLGKKLGVSEGEETAGEPAPQQRSEGQEDDGMKDLNQFLMTRQLLRSVATVTNAALEKLNKKTIKRS